MILAMAVAAAASVTLVGDASQTGSIRLYAAADARIVEQVGGITEEVPSTPTAYGREASVAWRCDRLQRTFRAVVDQEVSDPYTATTPGCEDRLLVNVPESVRRGDNVRVTIRDRWRVGGLSAVRCHRPVGGTPACDLVTLPAGQFLATRVYRSALVGRQIIRVTTAHQTVRRAVEITGGPAGRSRVPKILVTGDSLMLTPERALRRQVARRARVVKDVYPSAGLTKPYVVDWDTLPRKQVRAHQPDAVVMTLGIGDLGPLKVSARETIDCCGEDWVDAYAARARSVMRTYSRGGRTAVLWLNVPYPRDVPEGAITALNLALERAATGLRRVRVLDIAAIFTPLGSYSPTLFVDGEELLVRQDDGRHLTRDGANIAARAIRRALAGLGVPTARATRRAARTAA